MEINFFLNVFYKISFLLARNSVPVEEEETPIELKFWKKGTIYEVYALSFFDTDKDGYGDIQGIKF